MAQTEISIEGDAFYLNGQPTYPGREWKGHRIEGLLLNARVVQAIFDDFNEETRAMWAYPDTGQWDPERNTREFIEAMPEWCAHGLLGICFNLQGGSPQGYSKHQPWFNSGFEADGSLRPDYLARLKAILDEADRLGMVVILGLFYFGQDQRVSDEAGVVAAVKNAVHWLLEAGYRNVLLEINNECDVQRYVHDILKPPRVHELIDLARGLQSAAGHRLLVGTSYGGGTIPTPNVVRSSDYLLIHGNGVSDPERIAGMVRETRQVEGYRAMPIVFNEDDHFDFDQERNNFVAAVSEYASWGYFDPGKSNYMDGYQCPPVRWGLSTERKQGFFGLVKEMAGV